MSEDKKAEQPFDAQKAYLLHKGRSLYHTTRPVQLQPDESAEDFSDLGQRDTLLIAKHKDKELYRVTKIKKDGTHGATKYYAMWGAPCPHTKKAQEWEKARKAEYIRGVRAFEACIAKAAFEARSTGANVEKAIKAADAKFQMENPTFCCEF
jgi:hypothetical protein